MRPASLCTFAALLVAAALGTATEGASGAQGDLRASGEDGAWEAAALPMLAARPETWFFTTQRADLPDHGLQDVPLMAPQRSGTAGQAMFSSLPLDPSPVGGGPERVVRITWYRSLPLDLDMHIPEDATVVLYLDASVQAAARVRLELQATGADGRPVTLATADEAVTVGDPQAPETRITLADPSDAPAGAVLSLTVRLDGPGVATVLSYNSAEAPSRLEMRMGPLDSDEDGIPDTLERAAGTDPYDRRDPGDGAYDSDGDGLPDALEAAIGTDPLLADTDRDGWMDGAEVTCGSDPLLATSVPVDTDGDGLCDLFEARAGTSRTDADSNGNGLTDCLEDPDGDNLTNCQEQAWNTDPLSADTDGDGIMDGDEVRNGTDPLTHRSPPRPRQPQVAEVAAATVFLGAAAALAYVGLARRHRL